MVSASLQGSLRRLRLEFRPEQCQLLDESLLASRRVAEGHRQPEGEEDQECQAEYQDHVGGVGDSKKVAHGRERPEGKQGTQDHGSNADHQPQNRHHLSQLLLSNGSDRDGQEDQTDGSGEQITLHLTSPPMTPRSRPMVMRTMK